MTDQKCAGCIRILSISLLLHCVAITFGIQEKYTCRRVQNPHLKDFICPNHPGAPQQQLAWQCCTQTQQKKMQKKSGHFLNSMKFELILEIVSNRQDNFRTGNDAWKKLLDAEVEAANRNGAGSLYSTEHDEYRVKQLVQQHFAVMNSETCKLDAAVLWHNWQRQTARHLFTQSINNALSGGILRKCLRAELERYENVTSAAAAQQPATQAEAAAPSSFVRFFREIRRYFWLQLALIDSVSMIEFRLHESFSRCVRSAIGALVFCPQCRRFPTTPDNFEAVYSTCPHSCTRAIQQCFRGGARPESRTPTSAQRQMSRVYAEFNALTDKLDKSRNWLKKRLPLVVSGSKQNPLSQISEALERIKNAIKQANDKCDKSANQGGEVFLVRRRRLVLLGISRTMKPQSNRAELIRKFDDFLDEKVKYPQNHLEELPAIFCKVLNEKKKNENDAGNGKVMGKADDARCWNGTHLILRRRTREITAQFDNWWSGEYAQQVSHVFHKDFMNKLIGRVSPLAERILSGVVLDCLNLSNIALNLYEPIFDDDDDDDYGQEDDTDYDESEFQDYKDSDFPTIKDPRKPIKRQSTKNIMEITTTMSTTPKQQSTSSTLNTKTTVKHELTKTGNNKADKTGEKSKLLNIDNSVDYGNEDYRFLNKTDDDYRDDDYRDDEDDYENEDENDFFMENLDKESKYLSSTKDRLKQSTQSKLKSTTVIPNVNVFKSANSNVIRIKGKQDSLDYTNQSTIIRIDDSSLRTTLKARLATQKSTRKTNLANSNINFATVFHLKIRVILLTFPFIFANHFCDQS